MERDTSTLRAPAVPDNLRSLAPLTEFVNYCLANPELRFWQALRNWSGYPFIYAAEGDGVAFAAQMLDTFYWEGRRGD